MLATGLMHDGRTLFSGKQGQRLRHQLVQGLRAQAAAHHQQTQRAAAFGAACSGDIGSHRIAHPLGHHATAGNRFVVRMGEHLGESGQHTFGQTGQHAIGQPADRILFVDHQGLLSRLAIMPPGNAV